MISPIEVYRGSGKGSVVFFGDFVGDKGERIYMAGSSRPKSPRRGRIQKPESVRARIGLFWRRRQYGRLYDLLTKSELSGTLEKDEIEFLAGKVANKLGRYMEAFRHLHHLHRAKSAYLETGAYWFWLADTVLEMGLADVALKFIDHAILLYSGTKKSVAWALRSTILDSQGKFAEAVKAVKKELELSKTHKDPRDCVAMAYYHLGKLQSKLGRKKAALAAIKKSLELEPRHRQSLALRKTLLSEIRTHSAGKREGAR